MYLDSYLKLTASLASKREERESASVERGRRRSLPCVLERESTLTK